MLVVGKNEKTSSTDELRNENYKLIKMGADVGGIAGYAGGECGAGEVLAWVSLTTMRIPERKNVYVFTR